MRTLEHFGLRIRDQCSCPHRALLRWGQEHFTALQQHRPASHILGAAKDFAKSC